MGENNNSNLPPGFRFCPTDEDLVVHFLRRKPTVLPCHPDVIPDLGLDPYDPWDLDGKAMGEGNKWYYYSRITQRRITGNGYWNPSEIDEPIFSNSGQKVGMKKMYVFFVGESPERTKTNWIMEEFSLSDSATSTSRTTRRASNPDFSKWVVCRVYEYDNDNNEGDSTELSCLDEVFLSLEDLDETSFPN